LAARIRVIRHPRAGVSAALEARRAARPRARDGVPERRPAAAKRLVVIGGSTGAPGAVARILRDLPRSFPLPLIVVIHISPLFSQSLAEWLGTHTSLSVRLATDGEPLPPPGSPVVLMAPADRHVTVACGRIRLDAGPERHSCRPSVDVLFESVAREIGDQVVACLLTGMGADGAAGLLAIRRAGGDTIAQDEATSEIYGMPREAARLGAALRVLPLDWIAPALVAAAEPMDHALRGVAR
jgi:two-component system chemotaxis response regulator CheB